MDTDVRTTLYAEELRETTRMTWEQCCFMAERRRDMIAADQYTGFSQGEVAAINAREAQPDPNTDTHTFLAMEEARMLTRMSDLAELAGDRPMERRMRAMAKRVSPLALAVRRLHSPAGSRIAPLAGLGVHGPTLPDYGDVYRGRAERRAVRHCPDCGAVETGFPHTWHDCECARHPDAT